MLGWRPREFWQATLTEFFAAIDGYNRAQGGGPEKAPLTRSELDELMARYPDKL